MATNVTRQTPETGTPAATPRRHSPMTLRDEFDRLFDAFMPAALGRWDLDPWRARALRALGEASPSVDFKECADRYEIAAELPGMDEKDVEVSVSDDMLTIAGEKRNESHEEKEDMVLSERSWGRFSRSFKLPHDADAEAISADFAKGVLTVTVPKSAQAKPKAKTIEIRTH